LVRKTLRLKDGIYRRLVERQADGLDDGLDDGRSGLSERLKARNKMSRRTVE
jgi:hypothetical protein